MSTSSPLSRPLVLLLMPLLGPVLFLPLWAWRTVLRATHSRKLRALALAPGVYALAMALVVGLLRSWGSPAALGRADALAAYSPLNAAAHDLSLLVTQMGVLSPLEAATSAAVTWVVLAGTCTIFLSPIYARLAREPQLVA